MTETSTSTSTTGKYPVRVPPGGDYGPHLGWMETERQHFAVTHPRSSARRRDKFVCPAHTPTPSATDRAPAAVRRHRRWVATQQDRWRQEHGVRNDGLPVWMLCPHAPVHLVPPLSRQARDNIGAVVMLLGLILLAVVTAAAAVLLYHLFTSVLAVIMCVVFFGLVLRVLVTILRF